jgi:hypothetical protein
VGPAAATISMSLGRGQRVTGVASLARFVPFYLHRRRRDALFASTSWHYNVMRLPTTEKHTHSAGAPPVYSLSLSLSYLYIVCVRVSVFVSSRQQCVRGVRRRENNSSPKPFSWRKTQFAGEPVQPRCIKKK